MVATLVVSVNADMLSKRNLKKKQQFLQQQSQFYIKTKLMTTLVSLSFQRRY